MGNDIYFTNLCQSNIKFRILFLLFLFFLSLFHPSLNAAPPIRLVPSAPRVDIFDPGYKEKEHEDPLKNFDFSADLPSTEGLLLKTDISDLPDHIDSPILQRLFDQFIIQKVVQFPMEEKRTLLPILFKWGYFQDYITTYELLDHHSEEEDLNYFLSLCFLSRPDTHKILKMARDKSQTSPSLNWKKAAVIAEIFNNTPHQAELILQHLQEKNDLKDPFVELAFDVLTSSKDKPIELPNDLMEIALLVAGQNSIKVKSIETFSKQATMGKLAAAVNLNFENKFEALHLIEDLTAKGLLSSKVLELKYHAAPIQKDDLDELLETRKLPASYTSTRRRALLYHAALKSTHQNRAEFLTLLWTDTPFHLRIALFEATFPLLMKDIEGNDDAWFASRASVALGYMNQTDECTKWATIAKRESPSHWIIVSPFLQLHHLRHKLETEKWFETWCQFKNQDKSLYNQDLTRVVAFVYKALGVPLNRHTFQFQDISLEDFAKLEQKIAHHKRHKSESLRDVVIQAIRLFNAGLKNKNLIALVESIYLLNHHGLRKEAIQLAYEVMTVFGVDHEDSL